jgi:hypothetical protein
MPACGSIRLLLAASLTRHAVISSAGYGANSPAGSCAWHVLGCGRSVREWALRQGWGGRPVRQEQAQGMLVAALGLLAVHYGLVGRTPGSVLVRNPAYDRVLCESQSITSLALRSGGNTG